MKNCKNHPWIADLGNGFEQKSDSLRRLQRSGRHSGGGGLLSDLLQLCLYSRHPAAAFQGSGQLGADQLCGAEIPFPQYDQPNHGCGTWAPSIRYHDGMFYVFVGLPDEGVFMSCTRDPYGTWSPLHCVRPGKGWIDTCPFWDDDGNAYLVHAFANSRCGINTGWISAGCPRTGNRCWMRGTMVYNGIQDHPTLEGPKLYKRMDGTIFWHRAAE